MASINRFDTRDSVVHDDHGRISFDIIFDNINEYQKAYDEWFTHKSTMTTKDYRQIYDELKNKDDDIEEEKLMLLCEEFSGYVRLKKCLDMYYG